jgi:GNAT superfamily N-acetyltransferase
VDRDPGTAVFVAENDQGVIIGIAVCGMEQNHDPIYHGEIYLLYVLPQNQSQGIGRALVAACVQHLIHRLRMHTMLVWVLAQNPYRRFCESLGGKAVREKTQEIGGKLLSEVSYGWEELQNLL